MEIGIFKLLLYTDDIILSSTENNRLTPATYLQMSEQQKESVTKKVHLLQKTIQMIDISIRDWSKEHLFEVNTVSSIQEGPRVCGCIFSTTHWHLTPKPKLSGMYTLLCVPEP